MKKMTLDGNTAAAYISYAFSEMAIVYPITPSSPMAELADEWSTKGKPNLFGQVVSVTQMQSEAGAAGALHGALQCGSLATTYTCSQGLLLMLPNMYKIAGEFLPTVFHVSSRALSTHALSIFGDHQDVMACRATGFAMLCSSSVQETHDFALVSHLATLKSSIPFLHFFDGFRTSHELTNIDAFEYEELRAFIDDSSLAAFRARSLSPDKPCQRGTAQNPDVYFQNREAGNKNYLSLPDCVQGFFDELFARTGRQYRLFDYYGGSDAEHLLVLMGSAALTAKETVAYLRDKGERVALIHVRLYRPFDGERFCALIPKSCKTLSVLDRTKEAGALGEPLYLDVCTAIQAKGLSESRVFSGRYGLGGKEFTPAHVYAVLQNAQSPTPKRRFTVGICDDVGFSSLSLPAFFLPSTAFSCKFYGLGSDGTVGANKNSIKILGEHTSLYPQGYFCYDSRKSGGVTLSHLRIDKQPISAPYLIDQADFVACHNPSYLERYDVLSDLKEGGIFLLNCPFTDEKSLERYLPAAVKRQLAQKHALFYAVDGAGIAREVGLEGRISTAMQAAFFLLTPNLLPYAEAKSLLKEKISKKFQGKGDTVVANNLLCVDKVESYVRKIDYPERWKAAQTGAPILSYTNAPYFQDFILPILSLRGNELPVSAFEKGGSVPTGTSKWEKHGVPPFLPKWKEENCIQCNQCAFVCPHACIRPFLFEEEKAMPEGFATLPATGITGATFRIQVSPRDCMGCGVCARTCPTKEKALVMAEAQPLLEREEKYWEFAINSPFAPPEKFPRHSVKGSQFYPPLFEFSYACSGCGETPYIKLLTQLFGEKMLIANATGCSSIYGGSCPTCPYTVNGEGKGPAWANSLFEDNAEFGYGMALALAAQGRAEQRSVWIIGGDGWAYDIGYGGLDHVLASSANVNILVLDSEVYSNTGGQVSKATPLGAIARFAAKGKRSPKKDLGLMAMAYGSAYVAQVSMGANKAQLVTAFQEAEAYDGPSLIIAYSPCIAHGVYMGKCMEEEKLAVDSGYFPLYRFHPAKRANFGKGGNVDNGQKNVPTNPPKNAPNSEVSPLTLDSKPTRPLRDFLAGENRFARLMRESPTLATELFSRMESERLEKQRLYESLATFWQRKE